MAGSLNLGIQSITNEGRSLNQNQESYHTVIDVASVATDALRRSESRKMRRIKWWLLLGSFALEGSSLTFDQLSAPKKPIYAFMSMTTASFGFLISIIELSFRVRENDMIIFRLLGDALENFGFFGSTWQCIYAVLQYVFLYKKKINNLIKISALTLIFLICAAISRLYNNYLGDSSTQQRLNIGGESSMDASRTTTLSRVDEASVSLSNVRTIEETEPVVLEDEVLITTKKLRDDDTTLHRRIGTSHEELLHEDYEERKKGRLLTEEEHKLFLMGLKKYGKGDWRNISRNFVIIRTPTQVASHAQKYFIRKSLGGKDKRRASINDITTVNLNETKTPLPGPSPEQEVALHFQQAKSDSAPRTHYQWHHQQSKGTISSDSAQGNMFMASSFGIDSHGLKMQGQDLHRSSVHESSRTTTLSRVEASVSNAMAIEETEPVVQDDPGVLIATKKLRDDNKEKGT